jgi:hypothetical protein
MPNPHEGPTNEDWFQLADNSHLEEITDKIVRHPHVLNAADIALKHIDEAEQRRWDNFAAGKSVEQQYPEKRIA